MTVRTFGIVVLVLFVALLGYLGYLFARRWEPQQVGRYEVRRNRFTGIVEVKNGENWEQTLRNDPYADALSEADLQRVTLRDVAFGERWGLLCATAVVKPGAPPVKGRLALQLVVLGPDNKRRLTESERVMRTAVDWPAGGSIPIAVATGLTPPGPKDSFRVSLVTVHSEAGMTADKPEDSKGN